MASLTEKELSIMKDLLADEEHLVKKFNKLSEETEDAAVKQKFTNYADRHQQHFNAIYQYLQ